MERLRAWTVCRACCSVHPAATSCARCAGVALPAPVRAPGVPAPAPHDLDRVPAPEDPRSLKPRRAHVYVVAFALGVAAIALLAAFGRA